MQTFKDLFSTQASDYAKFRPHYPTELFHYLSTLPKHQNLAWDAGTGNGQAATALAKYFKHVIATDPSEKQINEATPKENITYKVESAETPSISEGTVDLIIVVPPMKLEVAWTLEQFLGYLKTWS